MPDADEVEAGGADRNRVDRLRDKVIVQCIPGAFDLESERSVVGYYKTPNFVRVLRCI